MSVYQAGEASNNNQDGIPGSGKEYR